MEIVFLGMLLLIGFLVFVVFPSLIIYTIWIDNLEDNSALKRIALTFGVGVMMIFLGFITYVSLYAIALCNGYKG